MKSMKDSSSFFRSVLIITAVALSSLSVARGRLQVSVDNDNDNSDTDNSYSVFQHPKLLDSEYLTKAVTDRTENGENYDNIVVRKDEYIVVLDDSTVKVEQSLKKILQKTGGKIERVYENLFKGGSISSMPLNRLKAFLDSDIVQYASPNIKVNAEQFTQFRPTWGLDRLDQTNSGGDSRYTYSYDGSGVYVYIVDTGIQLDHDEFGGTSSRATCGFSISTSSSGAYNCTDGFGHGTHVAGIVGGKTYGVAKNVQLIAVKVLNEDGEGSDSTVIAGIDFVVGEKKRIPSRNIVMNLSLGGNKSSVLNDAVNDAVDAGIVSIASAGNQGTDACLMSPGAASKAITVGSTTVLDMISTYSNVGVCVDIFAPGTAILSSYPSTNSTKRVAVISGTSMSAAFASGVAAMQLQKSPGSSPAMVWSNISSIALYDKILFDGKRRRSPNRLLNSMKM